VIQKPHDGHLVGDGDTAAVQAQGPDTGDGSRQIGDAEGHVNPVVAHPAKGRIVHDGAQAVGDRVPDHRIESRTGIDRQVCTFRCHGYTPTPING
jgi:hypothetical protein